MPQFAALDFQLKRGYAYNYIHPNIEGITYTVPLFSPREREYAMCRPGIREIIPGRLYLGDSYDAHKWVEEIAQNPNARKAILNIGACYPDSSYNYPFGEYRHDGRYYSIHLPDKLTSKVGEDPKRNPFLNFESLFNFIEENLSKGNRVVIHCAAGQSRSPSVVIGYLMRKYGLPLELAMYHVGACRHMINVSGFITELHDYEKFLGIKPLPESLPIAERLKRYRQHFNTNIPVIKWDTFSAFYERHKAKFLIIGLGIIVVACLTALTIAFPPAFVVSLLGVGVLGSGGMVASALFLGGLNSISLFACVAGSVMAVASLISFLGIKFIDSWGVQIETVPNNPVNLLQARSAAKSATNHPVTTVAPADANAASTVLTANKSTSTTSTQTPVPSDGQVLMPSKPLFAAPNTDGSTSAASSEPTKQSPASGPG